MRFSLLIAAALLICGPSFAAEEIALYPGVAPGSESWTWSETSSRAPVTNTLLYRNVVKPTLAVHPAEKPNGTAVLVVPGGGFRLVVYDSEGNRIADWLNGLGITAFVLKYRVAYTEPGVDVPPQARIDAVKPLAIADAKQAMLLIRQRAAHYGVKRLGAMGFSAGGWIVLALGTETDAATRPDFVTGIYPAMPPDLKAPTGAPPLFLTLASDDPYVPQDSWKAAEAWQAAKAPVEVHAYASGGHGFALKTKGLPVSGWTDRFTDWMTSAGFLPKP